MRGLWFLIKRYQISLIFLFLELIAFTMVVQQNYYQNAVFFNSANFYTGSILNWSNDLRQYFKLSQINKELAQENVKLRQILAQNAQKSETLELKPIQDSLIINKYTYSLAKVVNNSTYKANNYITIDKGKRHGIKKGMSVISSTGIVGKVVKCSENFSTIVSLLHSKIHVSVQIKRNGELGTIRWYGTDHRLAKLEDIPTNIKININDTIQTSGYNATFPPRTMVGIVRKVRLIPEKTFYDIDVEFTTKFGSLSYVYVIQDILKLEQEELESETLEEINE
jgi:rod shape-determining protein MreC